MKVPGTKYDPERDMTRDSKYRTPFGDLKVFFGSSAQHLKASICSHAGVPAGKYERRTFSNENIFIRLNESVRGQDVYIVQSMSSPVHDNFMELLIMIDAVMRDSAGRVNVVIPYLTYGRSDKKDQPRVPITARLVANMIETAGATGISPSIYTPDKFRGSSTSPAMRSAPSIFSAITCATNGSQI